MLCDSCCHYNASRVLREAAGRLTVAAAALPQSTAAELLAEVGLTTDLANLRRALVPTTYGGHVRCR